MFLNCHSLHSLRYGTIPLPELVSDAAALGVTAMALTDINTVTGIYDFYKACREVGIKPLVGIEFRAGPKLRYIGLAKNALGIAQMNRFLTCHNLDGTPLPERAPMMEDVLIIYPMENLPQQLGADEYIGVKPEQLNLLVNPRWKELKDKMVVLQPVTVRSKKEFNLHKILRAVDTNIILSRLTREDYCSPTERLMEERELKQHYERYPQLIKTTMKLIDQCNFSYEFGIPRNKKYYTNNQKSDMRLLTTLTEQGLQRRYGQANSRARERAMKELKVIDELHFSGYFLITWDIVRYSNSMGFMHVGRGSGANSIVAYCLGITDVCPLELDLYFERFLNQNRKSPPDFDIDWSWKQRDVILQYIFDRYGRDHVAFCGTNVEFKYRSIFREVGKVFGLPKEELDQLAKNPMAKHDSNPIVKIVQEYGMMMEKYPNQRSMHSCGILISEEPITNFTALEMPPKGFPIVQFDMHVAEDIGFDKFDILSQRGLGHIEEATLLVEKNRGIKVDIRNTRSFKQDPLLNERLSQGRTIGCFYIESPAMRGLLRRLKCDNYRTLVAASSIIRPGVAQSGMMKEYVWRHNHPGQFEYFHQVFAEHLSETYGIMVYQEDVIKIAMHYGGLEAADGDILRRSMSGKGRSKAAMQKVKDNFFRSSLAMGHSLADTTEVYRQIESFAGYSFCKAHSASYAEESYQSLFLKVYHPMEFITAVINNGGGFYRTEVYVHEAKMSGATIHNPCVNRSMMLATVDGSDIYMGLLHLEKLETTLAEKILLERECNGNYRSLEDFIKRIQIGIETLQILIFIGAFRFTGLEKNELVIKARLLLVNFRPEHRTPSLIDEPVKEYKLPQLDRSPFEDAFDEIDLLGFPVSFSPFDLLVTKYRGDVMAKDLAEHHKEQVRMMAYLISRKHVPTKRGDMFFGTWIDAEGNYFDTAHFADSLLAYPFEGGGCYLLLGKVEVDFHFPTVTIHKMKKMPFIADPRYSNSDAKQFTAHQNLREDVSMTHRAPYPSEQEIGLPRHKMK
ncbi:DNA polymerase III subunit alpha [uncultured Pedobacter sp.]|uniref:DNA polymerase III subunit alpha n=1 Tax=uncultured Pedobacter sp. TaxID=246139 RepID=UPI002603A40D|nr:DNA polymerase III subunit alpha [uncultured Pedobacter sp.]